MDKDGCEARVALLKATFDICTDRTLRIADEQEPPCYADIFLGEPGKSSTIYESDGAFFKPATDIIVVGTAYAPRGKSTARFEAGFRIGRLAKVLTVVGDRHWDFGLMRGLTMSDPQPITEMPIEWEKAFGGADTTAEDPSQHDFEGRNPIGTGFCTRKSSDRINGLPLPNFEYSQQRIARWNDRPPPAGFGFIGRSWQPRISYAGTYDDKWQKTRMPLLPEDFDYHFFNAAPDDQVYPGYLQGGESVRIASLSRRGTESFALPTIRVSFSGFAKQKQFELDAPLDTVLLDLENYRVVLSWRVKYSVRLSEPADEVNARLSQT